MKMIRTRKSYCREISFGKLIAFFSLIAFNFANKAAADGPWNAWTQLTSTQGSNGWYYQERPQGAQTPVANLFYSDVQWRTSDYPASGTGWLGSYSSMSGHPGQTCDIIRKWVAPSSGTVSITGNVFKIDTGGGGGIIATVEKSGTVIWSKTVAYNDNVGYSTDSALGAVAVNSGDAINFVVDDNGVFGNDAYQWNPTITKVGSYNAWLQLTSTQGSNGWYYQERPQGAQTPVANLFYSDAQWRTSDYPASGTGWLGSYSSMSGHPGQTCDIIRKWIPPAAGTISIKGSVFKIDTGGGGGIIATVEKSGTVIWSKTVAYNDAVGYSTDANLCNLSVSTTDTIAFVVDDNNVFGNDAYQWNPTISYEGCTGSSWMLNTDDTLMTIIVNGNVTQITNLEDAVTHSNWVSSAQDVPMPTATSGGSPNWSYTSATKDTTSGTKVTLTYTSTSPSLTLTQCWWAHPGVGPVEETTSITNNSGSTITYNDIDVVAADLTVTADSTVTLWRFNRSSLSPGNGSPTSTDTGFTTGVFKDTMNANSTITTTVSNDDGTVSGNAFTGFLLPFIMLDVPDATQPHGLYIGYTCDFGKFTTTAGANQLNIESIFKLYNSGSFSQLNNTTLSLPGMFVGAYKGDTDCGSNKMKKWFWINKMTPTIKSTSNEPLLSLNLGGSGQDANSQAHANALFSSFALAGLGYELGKEDTGWGDDQNPFGYDWNPNNTGQWPNGMTLGSIAHNNGVKLSLYMANRYNSTDLSTAAGVSSEETALQTRFNGTATNWVAPGFDYWRTDIDFEGHYDYGNHLGFMQVLDYMISSNSGFRWENCSSGGSKKSFDILQRQSFMTTVDDGSPTLGFRQAYYANSYIINSVQMQFTSYEGSGLAGATAYQHRNGFLGAWLLGLPDAPITGEASLYKNTQRPILRGADVYHILSIADGTHWDGFEFLNTTLATNPKGSVILFKPDSSVTSSGTFYLKGLVPGNNYTLSYQDRPGSNTTVSGSTLMSGGTGITISGSANVYDSEIIWLSW